MNEYLKAKQRLMQKVPYIQKKKSKGLDYTYAGEKELIAKVRPAMLAEGFSCFPCNIIPVSNEAYKTSKGNEMQRMRFISTYRFSHTSGDSEDVVVVGEAGDTSDKVASKAMTLAYKYAIRQWLMIETGDDPDKGRPEDATPATTTAFDRGLVLVKDSRELGGEEIKKAESKINSHKQLSDDEKAQLLAMLHA